MTPPPADSRQRTGTRTRPFADLRTNLESTVAEWRDTARRGTAEKQRARLRAEAKATATT